MNELLFEEKQKNTNFDFNIDGLDDSQKVPVLSDKQNILVKAPAGSGKTLVAINAISAYRYNWLADKICAITFTRAAKAEMLMRLNAMGIFDVDVTTIHVWARNILEKFSVMYDFKLKILNEKQIKVILEDIVGDYLLTHRSIRSVNIDILYSFINGNKNMDISDNYKRTLMALENRYVTYKEDNGLYDFTDYPRYLLDVLTAYNQTIEGIDALFVDEFQDVSEIEIKLFDKVNCKKKFFVGDEWQSIYMFRGSISNAFGRQKGFEQYQLKYNYRSYQEIIDYACNVYITLQLKVMREEDCFISEVMKTKDSNIICRRGWGGYVTVVNPYGFNIQFHNQGIDKVDINTSFCDIMSRNPMILCRTNREVKMINEKGYYNVSTVHQAKGLEYNSVIVIDFSISSDEDLNIAYVALTRAKNEVMVIDGNNFHRLYDRWNIKKENKEPDLF